MYVSLSGWFRGLAREISQKLDKNISSFEDLTIRGVCFTLGDHFAKDSLVFKIWIEDPSGKLCVQYSGENYGAHLNDESFISQWWSDPIEKTSQTIVNAMGSQ